MRSIFIEERDIFEPGDLVSFTAPEDIAHYGTGGHQVLRASLDTVTIRVVVEKTVPADQVTLHSNRPIWMEPDYVKCG